MSIVIGETSKTEYELKAESGRGMTAIVYRAVPKAGDGPTVAVKVAYERMSAEEKNLFWGELEMLQKLAGSNRVPKNAEKGEFLTQQDKPDSEKTGIIIQEWTPRDWSLSRQIKGPADETLFLKAASQYAQLLDYMFRHGVTTRGDRKLPDLHWEPNEERLIVLDWNRAVADNLLTGEKEPAALESELGQKLAQTDNLKEKAELREKKDRLIMHRNHILTDIRLFSRLWGQLLGINLDPEKLPDLNDEISWGGLSLGTRYLLVTAVQSRQSWGFQEPKELQKAIDAHLARWEKSADTLLAKAKELKKSADNLPLWERIETAEKVLILIDLIKRKLYLSSDSSDLDNLHKWARDFINKDDVTKRFSEKARTIDYYLDLSLFDQAAKIIREAQAEFANASPPMPYYQVILHRLEAVIKAGETGSRQLRQAEMERRLKNLRDYLAALALATPSSGDVPTSSLNHARQVWEEADSGDDDLNEAIRPLHLELQLWTAVAGQDFKQATSHWQSLLEINRHYALALKDAYSPLDEIFVAGAGARILSTRKEEFKNAVTKLRQALSARADADTSWDTNEIVNIIRPCERAFYALPETTDEEEKEYAFVAAFRNINDYLWREELNLLLEELYQSNDDENWPDVQKIATKKILEQIRQRAEKRGWPADLCAARNLLEQVSSKLGFHRVEEKSDTYFTNYHEEPTKIRENSSDLWQKFSQPSESPKSQITGQNEQFLSQYQNVKKLLDEWDNFLKEARNTIGVTDDNLEDRYEELCAVSGSVEEEEKIDTCLQKAELTNTELFEKREHTIANLIAKRESNLLETYMSSIIQLGKALERVKDGNQQAELKEKAREWWALSGQIDNLLKKGEQLNLDTRVNALVGRLNILHDLHYQLGIAIPDPSQATTALEKRLDEYEKQITKIDDFTGRQLPTIQAQRASAVSSLPSSAEDSNQFETTWSEYKKLHDTPDTLKKCRELLDQLLDLRPQTAKQMIWIAQAEDNLQKRENINGTLVDLAQKWQDRNIGSVALDNALDFLSKSDLVTRTIKCFKRLRANKLPLAYAEPIRQPIQELNGNLNPEQLQTWVEEGWEEGVCAALLVRLIASQFHNT